MRPKIEGMDRIALSITKDEKRKARKVADARFQSVSQVLREMINNEYDRIIRKVPDPGIK